MSELLNINVSGHVEKKNGLSYLSWAWAWAEVLKIDPQATWEPEIFMHDQYTPAPFMRLPDGTCMVKVSVVIKGHAKSCLLPVMDHRNKAIKEPDAFAVNTAIMRCMTKAVSMHGLGLYIYAGEDLPEEAAEAHKPTEKAETPAKPPVKSAGKPGGWQITVTTKPNATNKDYIDIVAEATVLALETAQSQADVMEIFKVNRSIFDKVKEMDPDSHKDLMDAFKTKKDALK